MQKWMLGLLLVLAGAGRLAAQGSYNDRVNNYIAAYKDMAIYEQQRSGVPAAITLGQGVLETQAGGSELCTIANNHFGIKCRKEWTGETFAHTDDRPNECFRKYGNAKDSYKDHSDYLASAPRYSMLFQLDKTDYAAWAHGLKRCGYATNPRYAYQLIKIIEDFKLQDYTYAAINGRKADAPVYVASAGHDPVSYKTAAAPPQETADSPKYIYTSAPPAAAPKPVTTINIPSGSPEQVNNLRAVYARKGDVLLDQAIKYNIRYAKLLEINDLPDAPLEADMYIYLERKHTQGKEQYHTVATGETLIQIAQAQGMQLKQLRIFNFLMPNEQPLPGQILALQGQNKQKPLVIQQIGAQNPDVANAGHGSPEEYIVKKKTTAPETVAAVNTPVQTSQPMQAPATAPVPSSVTPDPVTITHKESPAAGTVPATDPLRIPEAGNTTQTDAPAVNIANETAVEEEPDTEPQQAQPADEISRLKAKLDKVVYSTNNNNGNNSRPQDNMVRTYNAPNTVAPAANSEDKFYVVKKGDTGFTIAKKHNITVKQLRDWNKLEFEALKPGQKLRVKP